MKVLVVFALALATASAGFLPNQQAVHPKDVSAGPSIDGRITNGKTASKGQFPYLVGLVFTNGKNSWSCGASIIDREYLLTAAHCTDGATSVNILYGATVRSSPEFTQTVSSSNFIQHASYNSLLLRNDISLIKTPAISFSTLVNKVKLPALASGYSTYVGQKAVASGFGKTSDAATSVSNTQQYADFVVMPLADCKAVYGSLTITDRNLCVAAPNKVSTCSGDSGGPLVLISDEVLIGVTSFVHVDGCESGNPDGFSSVSYFLTWIYDNSGVSS